MKTLICCLKTEPQQQICEEERYIDTQRLRFLLYDSHWNSFSLLGLPTKGVNYSHTTCLQFTVKSTDTIMPTDYYKPVSFDVKHNRRFQKHTMGMKLRESEKNKDRRVGWL